MGALAQLLLGKAGILARMAQGSAKRLGGSDHCGLHIGPHTIFRIGGLYTQKRMAQQYTENRIRSKNTVLRIQARLQAASLPFISTSNPTWIVPGYQTPSSISRAMRTGGAGK
jgi:hypothetical protein